MNQPPEQPQQQWPPQQPQQPQWMPPPQPQWAPQPQQAWQQPPQQPPQQPAQQPAQQPQPYQPPRPPGPSIGTHLKRAFDWNVAAIVPAPREQQILDARQVAPRLHGLFVWRRSTLIVALPVLLLSVVLAFWQAGHNDVSGLTGFGKLLNWLPAIALLFAPLGALLVLRNWTELRRTSKSLLVCWILSIAIPLFVALMPLTFLVDVSGARENIKLNGTASDLQAFDAEVLIARLGLAIQFALTLLPVVLSIPGGVLKGAGRIKSLFPSAALPGWFLVAVAPFYSLFMVVVFVLVDQLVGDGLLLVAVAVLAFTPWLFVIHRKVYGRPLSTEESRTELARASRGGGWLTLAAIALLVIYVFKAKVGDKHVVGANSDSATFTYVQVLRTVGEVLSRGMVTAVVFSTIFMYLVYAEWKTMTQLRPDIRHEHDEQIGALQHYLDSPTR